MRIQGWVLLACMGMLGIGCGSESSDESMPGELNPVSGMKVLGSAAFGSQCPYGTVTAPQPVPVELWDCPIPMNQLELAENLPPLTMQADCKKKTLDVRGNNFTPLTWELMPDGNFYFSFDVGNAKIKNDGSGNANCSVPMAAEMWGRVDCTDRDHAIIKVETLWWLGKQLNNPEGMRRPSGVPSVSPSASPSVLPSSSPSPIVIVPSPRPSPRMMMLGPSDTGATQCNLPKGCYLHNISHINQCS